MDESKKCENEGCGKYSIYVHGWFLPWLDQLREKGELRQGKS